MTHTYFETRTLAKTRSTHPFLLDITHTQVTCTSVRGRKKNIRDRLIGILLHSNNCCAHRHLTNKNHIGNKSSPFVNTYCCVLKRKTQSPHTFAVPLCHLPYLFSDITTTETKHRLAKGEKKKEEGRGKHSACEPPLITHHGLRRWQDIIDAVLSPPPPPPTCLVIDPTGCIK